MLLSNFNSIKVRLERINGLGSIAGALLFQFHKGTIRTNIDAQAIDMFIEFQFHKGTIRTHRCRLTTMKGFYFNSIKVRLERNFLPDTNKDFTISIP